ncbi:MAG: tetratricopeptide repeat protein [Candidatus Omnitrophica bacterium]|nr:tetratricopeptide repeat protein [Candidatus Omnitrophota bacterium]
MTNNTAFKKPLLIFFLTAVIILLVVFFAASSFIPGSGKGSFEYVRKGMALADKGNYQQAIKYFEKAHESSPDNEVIAENLAWAYSSYASDFVVRRDYDKAIEYMTRAYEVLKNGHTIQNLAIMYSRRALAYLGSGERREALEDLETARSIAADSDRAMRNLAIFLFNEAVEEYKRGHEDNAITCLEESTILYDDSRIFEFMGDIYYKKVELEKAYFYWSKAKGLDPENKYISEKLDKVKKEKALAGSEKRSELSHFELRYDKSLGVDEALVNETLEDAYTRVGNDLGYFPPSKTKIFFYPEYRFREIFKLPEVVRAFYDGSIRMPYPEGGIAADELARYIYHEYVHAVVSAKTNNNCPSWFNEGMAVWEELKDDDTVARTVMSGLPKDVPVSFRSLEGAFGKSQDENTRYYYVLAYTVVKYIVDRWGIEGLREILARMGKGQHLMNAIDDQFLISEKEFEKDWTDYVRKNYFAKMQ